MRAYRMMSLDQSAQLAEVALSAPRRGELQLRIAACGLNFADLLMLRGQYQEKPALPLILGMEMAGTVSALGPGTAGPAPGTRVALYSG
ncbi:NADPH:quinone oxidoreductase family protein, partial [Thioclava sp. BHET1]